MKHESRVYENPQEYSQGNRREILTAWSLAARSHQYCNGDVFMEQFRTNVRHSPGTSHHTTAANAMMAKDPAFFYGGL